jgi:hypothetical protein
VVAVSLGSGIASGLYQFGQFFDTVLVYISGFQPCAGSNLVLMSVGWFFDLRNFGLEGFKI